MNDLISIADAVTATINAGLLPAESPDAVRHWEFALPPSGFEELRVVVLPIPSEISSEEPDESTLGDEAERVICEICVQKTVGVVHEDGDPEAGIKHHNRDDCDAVARVALGLQNEFRRLRIADANVNTIVTATSMTMMGYQEHLQIHDVFTAVVKIELELDNPIL